MLQHKIYDLKTNWKKTHIKGVKIKKKNTKDKKINLHTCTTNRKIYCMQGGLELEIQKQNSYKSHQSSKLKEKTHVHYG